MRLQLARSFLYLLLLAAGICSCAGLAQQVTQHQTGELPGGFPVLPALSELPLPETPRQTSATAEIELLQRQPLLLSDNASAVWLAGSLSLKPGLNAGRAYAVFGLAGMPQDGSIIPQRLSSGGGGPLWIALANYSRGRWEWREVSNAGSWNLAFLDEADYVSDAGAVYVAVLRSGPLTKQLNRLSLFISDPIFGEPSAVITLRSKSPTLGHPTNFDFSASMAGPNPIASASFTPEAGASPIAVAPELPLPASFAYTYPAAGEKQAQLRLVDEFGATSTATLELSVSEARRDVLVVYNSSVQESAELANYYASPETGRGIHPDFKMGIGLGGGARETSVTRAEYNDLLRDSLRGYIDAKGIKQEIKYLVLMKGLPHQITGAGSDAVDSELCLLYENGNYDASLRLFSDVSYPLFSEDYDDGGFYEGLGKVERSFQPFTYKCVNLSNQQFTISYLVSRISAYSYAEARLMIDRALEADQSGSGCVVLDTHPNWYSSETMVDPVWPWATDSHDSLADLLIAADHSRYIDDQVSLALSSNMPADLAQNVIAYTGWGTRHAEFGGQAFPSGKLYLLNDLGFTYLPGACFVDYEPFAAASFAWDGNEASHHDQGQICDFIRSGGTVAIGNCYEPFTDGMPDERRVIERYVLKGDPWIEAAYKGIRYFSWHTIVLGDPLCRVRN